MGTSLHKAKTDSTNCCKNSSSASPSSFLH